MKNRIPALLLLSAAWIGTLGKQAEAQLLWPDPPKKVSMRVRLVAVTLALPRSSYFFRSEVFVAETQIAEDEWRLIKLGFTFLPYQPRLSQTGFDYSLVHELMAWRNPECDETIAQLTTRNVPKRHVPLVYARNVPTKDLDRRPIRLPCYETNADDYIKSSLAPESPPGEPRPTMRQRPDKSR